MAAVNPFLQVDHLTFAVGDKVLFRDVSFGIAEGQRVGLIAQNGAGKSSLLKLIAGEEEPESGEKPAPAPTAEPEASPEP